MAINNTFVSSGGGGITSISSASLYNNMTISDTTTLMSMNNADKKVKVTATLEVNGRDVMQELDEMRDALMLLKRDVDMESKYPRLKEIKDMYEQELEKYKTFERLK